VISASSESPWLRTSGRGLVVLGAAAHHSPQGGVEAEAFGVVDILLAGQPAIDRRAEEGEQAVAGELVKSRAGLKWLRGPIDW
jgi:hypothetical protein